MVFSLFTTQERLNPHPVFVVRQSYNCCLFDRRVAIKSCLDLTQLDPIPPLLNHPISPAKVNVVSISFLHDDVPRLVPTLTRRANQEGTGGPFRQVPVTLRDP